VWKMGQMGEVQEGEEVRPGLPLLDVIDPARMRVRVRVNQADAPLLRIGQTAVVQLDAYPGRQFSGTLQTITPAAVTSVLSPRARWVIGSLVIDQTDPLLLPDLTASVDVMLQQEDNALVVPRDSILLDGGTSTVSIQSGGGWSDVPVTIGAVGDTDVVVTAGLQEGAVVRRRRSGQP
jgi:HlyD family secretion protein